MTSSHRVWADLFLGTDPLSLKLDWGYSLNPVKRETRRMLKPCTSSRLYSRVLVPMLRRSRQQFYASA